MSSIVDAARGVLKVIRAETLNKTAERIVGLRGSEKARAVRNTLVLVRVMDWLIGDRPTTVTVAPPSSPPLREADRSGAVASGTRFARALGCAVHGVPWPCAECERLAS